MRNWDVQHQTLICTKLSQLRLRVSDHIKKIIVGNFDIRHCHAVACPTFSCVHLYRTTDVLVSNKRQNITTTVRLLYITPLSICKRSAIGSQTNRLIELLAYVVRSSTTPENTGWKCELWRQERTCSPSLLISSPKGQKKLPILILGVSCANDYSHGGNRLVLRPTQRVLNADIL